MNFGGARFICLLNILFFYESIGEEMMVKLATGIEAMLNYL